MPRKIRRAKRRTDSAAEAQAWAGVFETGHDFFDELHEFGIFEPFGVAASGSTLEPRAKAQSDFISAARDAWHRLGAAFLATWQPNQVRDTPWALEHFGDPTCP